MRCGWKCVAVKILITGSRKWRDVAAIEKAILNSGATVVVHGANPNGADNIAESVAKKYEINYRGYPAKWKTFGKQAGPIRNNEMLNREHFDCLVHKEGIDTVYAFPTKESIGTWDMIEQAEHCGILCIVDRSQL